MGYLQEPDFEDEGIPLGRRDPAEPYNPFEPEPTLEALRNDVKRAQKAVNAAKNVLSVAVSTSNKKSRALQEAKARLKKAELAAEGPVRGLSVKLRSLATYETIQFTTGNGHTYVAMKVGIAWYLSQDGTGLNRKPPLHSLPLARFIGTAKVRIVREWTDL